MGRAEKLPRVLSEDEQKALLSQLNERYWTPHRDRTAMLAMLDAGLRVSEVTALTLDHVDLSRRKLTVRDGKGGVDRQLRIPPRLHEALEDWIDRRAEKVGEDCDVLFPTQPRKLTGAAAEKADAETGGGKPLHPNHLRRKVKQAAKKADLREADRISPHTLRHTAAVDLLRETGRLEIVQEFLGHADISTTRRYARLVNGELDDALSRFREPKAEDDGDEPDEEVTELAEKLAGLDADAREQLKAALDA